MYNRFVGSRLVSVHNALVVLLALAAGSSDLVALRFSARARACCAKTHNKCAGLKTPDDCCRSMGHGFGTSVSTAPAARASDVGLTLAVLSSPASPAAVTSVWLLPGPTFKRPHDPPHLHPIALLI